MNGRHKCVFTTGENKNNNKIVCADGRTNLIKKIPLYTGVRTIMKKVDSLNSQYTRTHSHSCILKPEMRAN